MFAEATLRRPPHGFTRNPATAPPRRAVASPTTSAAGRELSDPFAQVRRPRPLGRTWELTALRALYGA